MDIVSRKTVMVFLSLFSALAIPLAAQAQNRSNVTGQIVDLSDNSPIPGALLRLDSATLGVTNDNGFFSIRLSPGSHTIRITSLGYEPLPYDLTVPEGGGELKAGKIGLRAAVTTVDEIVVSASPLNYRTDFLGSNYRLSPGTIANRNPMNTEEVLRTVPGVNIIGDMGLSNRPNISIRGSWGRRSSKILLLEDGSPAAPAPYMAPGAYYNPVSDRIRAIEVYKGADMLRFGPNNMFGAVNYITALPPQEQELRIKAVGGERGYMTGLLSYGGTWGNLGSLIEGVYKRFDGFTDNSSVQVLNLNAKIFSRLSENQSLYFKLSGQFEENQASLSSITPTTFEIDPTENPFDADVFTMRRYGADIVHKWVPGENLNIVSKVFASDFERDWWRQIPTKVKAADVRDYVGEEIFNDRYRYLEGGSFTDDDYVLVGRIRNGREGTTDSRWIFTVAGWQETMDLNWDAFGERHNLEVGAKLYRETYNDATLQADSSRWGRSGLITADLYYRLWSLSGYVRNMFRFADFRVTPIFRVEHVDMFRQNQLALSRDPLLEGSDENRQYNTYDVFLPGLTLSWVPRNNEIYTSLYEGFIAPNSGAGFLVERNGVVADPLAGESIDIPPELSLVAEAGWRGSLLADRLDGQAAVFSNSIRNFYTAGRNEIFRELGKVDIRGIEAGLVAHLFGAEERQNRLDCHLNVTWLRSAVTAGSVEDKDMFGQVVHSSATREEFVAKVNANRDAYELYATDGQGNEVPIENRVLTVDDFGSITRALLKFGDGLIDDAQAPYTPDLNISGGIDYSYHALTLGLNGTYVGSQYTEFANFENESADGALGKLEGFFTLDAFANYTFHFSGDVNVKAFVNGKNITNNVYKASRLNRASSGIFPAGFREIIVGVNLEI